MSSNSNSKLREAVESLLDLLDDIGITEEIILIANENRCYKESLHTDKALEVLRKAKDALAEPLRNCDIGTAEEQVLRHHKEFCGAHSGDEVCCAQYNCEYCFSRWAQAPYGDSPPMITIDSYTKGE